MSQYAVTVMMIAVAVIVGPARADDEAADPAVAVEASQDEVEVSEADDQSPPVGGDADAASVTAGANASVDVGESATDEVDRSDVGEAQPARSDEDEMEVAGENANEPPALTLAQIAADHARPGETPDAQRRQMVELVEQAGQIIDSPTDPKQQLAAANLKLQAIYKQATKLAEPERIDRLLFQLRAGARRAKTIEASGAESVGDFWLMVADLYDLKRVGLSMAAQREQAGQMLREYLLKHPGGPAAWEARQSIERLDRLATGTPEP